MNGTERGSLAFVLSTIFALWSPSAYPGKEKSIPRNGSNAQRRDSAPQREDVPDQVVFQVGKALVEIMKVRQHFFEDLATAETEEERQNLTVRAIISDQGLTVDQYNQIVAATQADADLEERVMVAYRMA